LSAELTIVIDIIIKTQAKQLCDPVNMVITTPNILIIIIIISFNIGMTQYIYTLIS